MASSDNYSGPSSFSYDLVSRLLAKLVPADRQQSVSAVLLAAGVTCCCTLGAAFVAKRVLAASGQGNKKNSDVVNPVRYIEGHPIFGAMLEINGREYLTSIILIYT